MNHTVNKELYDSNAALYVLSSLMHKPIWLQDAQFALTQQDFCQTIQQIIFSAIFNMAQQGFSVIRPSDIDLYLKSFDNLYEYYTTNRGFEMVQTINEMTEDATDKKQFEYYYNRLKKFSILRDLQGNGFDITEFYNPNQDFTKLNQEDEKLNNIKLKDIPEHIRKILVQIENKHLGKGEGHRTPAGQGMRNLLDELRKNPEVGEELDGVIWNYATRGARFGKLYTYSAPSGSGKTRHMVGNACALSLPYIDDNGKIVVRENLRKTLFVSTEMTADEIQTLILAYVSGVNEKKILLGDKAGTISTEEVERLNRAVNIIEKYSDNFIIEAIPDPSIAMIKTTLTTYILQENIKYIFYDYIFSSPGLLNEFSSIGVREDVALMMLSNTLKEIAMTYGVFIESATQLNDSWSKQLVRNQNCIRGSKAVADKIDIGAIGIRLEEQDEEFKKIATILREKHLPTPNIVIDIYKNRRGELNSVKIFRQFDYGTCRCKDILITDNNYNWRGDSIAEFEYSPRSIDYLELMTERKVDEDDKH